MATLRISRSTLAELERRHVAFLEERLVSERAREDWIRAAEAAADAIREVRIRDLFDPRALAGNLHRALGTGTVRTFFSPLLARMQRELVDVLRDDDTRLGDHVPEDARLAI